MYEYGFVTCFARVWFEYTQISRMEWIRMHVGVGWARSNGALGTCGEPAAASRARAPQIARGLIAVPCHAVFSRLSLAALNCSVGLVWSRSGPLPSPLLSTQLSSPSPLLNCLLVYAILFYCIQILLDASAPLLFTYFLSSPLPLRRVHAIFIHSNRILTMIRSSASDELLGEKERYRTVSDELDKTFAELTGFWAPDPRLDSTRLDTGISFSSRCWPALPARFSSRRLIHSIASLSSTLHLAS